MPNHITIKINDIQSKYLDELVEMGIFGATREEVVERIVDRRFLELIDELVLREFG